MQTGWVVLLDLYIHIKEEVAISIMQLEEIIDPRRIMIQKRFIFSLLFYFIFSQKSTQAIAWVAWWAPPGMLWHIFNTVLHQITAFPLFFRSRRSTMFAVNCV